MTSCLRRVIVVQTFETSRKDEKGEEGEHRAV